LATGNDYNFVVKNGLYVNTTAVINSTSFYYGTINTSSNGVVLNTANITIGNASVNASINSTSFTGTANNTSFVGTVSAANVVSNAQLAANLANYAQSLSPIFTSNVNITTNGTGALYVGNSTVNTWVTSSGFYVNGSPLVTGTSYTKGNQGVIGSPSSANNIFRINANTISNNITFDAQDNASAAGPLRIATGYTVTISTGARVTII